MAFAVCNLGSGSAGNCTLVRSGRTSVLIDIGFSARQTTRRLAGVGARPEELSAILLTHEHTDHVAGAVVASRRWRVPIFCRPAVARAAGLAARGAHAVEPLPMAPFDLGDLQVASFPVPHDAVETVGFVLQGEGIRLGYAADLGYSTAVVEEHLQGCHVVALEANHDPDLVRQGPYPWNLKKRILGERGHLSNDAMGELLARVIGTETRQVVLTHLSEINNSPVLALMAAQAAAERSANPEVEVTAAEQQRPGTAMEF